MNEANPTVSEFDSDPSHDQPGWPKTVGIISIVWASLGLVCNTCGIGGMALGKFAAGMAPPEKQAEIQAQMAANQPPSFVYVVMLGKIVLAVLLLVGGITLLGRKASSRPIHIAWSWLALLLVAGSMVMGILTAPEQAKKAQDALAAGGPGSSWASMSSTQGAIIGMTVGAAAITAVWPIFCLVWFGVKGKRPQAGHEPIAV